MAFEDRFSPSAATSPNSGDVNQNPPDSPESSRTSPYTCQIIQKSDSPSRMQLHFIPNSPSSTDINQNSSNCCSSQSEKSSFFRITSYALSKEEPLDSFKVYSSNSQSPLSPNISPTSDTESTSSERPKSPNSESTSALKYSIFNILQPDFGKTAVQKTKTAKIAFKPYERNLSIEEAPLGSLCHAVSQIGRGQDVLPAASTIPDAEEHIVPVPVTSPSGSSTATTQKSDDGKKDDIPQLWPAWVYCTRYSDRPSSGPRSRRMKKPPKATTEEKRPRTAFSGAQLARLKHEFAENRYLTERRRQQLSGELGLNEAQIKIWFQNKRAKMKKASGQKNPLALQLMAQGLYNHTTVACDEDDMPLDIGTGPGDVPSPQ